MDAATIRRATPTAGRASPSTLGPNFAAIVDALEDEFENTLILSSGDNYIPGPLFNAAGDRDTFREGGVFNDTYNELFGTDAFNALREGEGRVDISIMNIIGFDASDIGNHEFDNGSDAFENIIEEDFRDPAGPDADRWVGAQFPYLSANLDFSQDADLGNLFTDEILLNTEFQTGVEESQNNETSVPKIAPATLIAEGGELVGVVGEADVFIEGRREFVRTEETTLDNLTADANLAVAQSVDDTVMVSIKNAGGIRAPIGEIDGLTGELLPTQENPASGKEEGEISQLDIENALRFNNGLTVLTLDELKIVLEHGVAATAPGAPPGQFAQVGGLGFSFDPDGTAQVLDGDGNVTTAGTRIQDIALIDENGNATQALFDDGIAVAGAPSEVRIVTLNFLADGGDGYPFAAFEASDPGRVNRVELTDIDPAATPETELDGNADFASFGSEQDALAEFLAANFPVDSALPRTTPTVEGGRDLRLTRQHDGRAHRHELFSCRIDVPEENLVDVSEEPMQPGMPAEAMIRTGERTAIDYLTQPIVESMNRAWRED